MKFQTVVMSRIVFQMGHIALTEQRHFVQLFLLKIFRFYVMFNLLFRIRCQSCIVVGESQFDIIFPPSTSTLSQISVLFSPCLVIHRHVCEQISTGENYVLIKNYLRSSYLFRLKHTVLFIFYVNIIFIASMSVKSIWIEEYSVIASEYRFNI